LACFVCGQSGGHEIFKGVFTGHANPVVSLKLLEELIEGVQFVAFPT
jgi:hypothetical protein